MNKKDSHNMEGLNAITERVAKALGVERGLREIALINLWSDIVGPRFHNKSKIVSVMKKSGFDILMVAVSSPSVSQELLLFKGDVLKKLLKVASPMGFNIKDIVFNTKLWQEIQNKDLPQKQEETAHIFIKNPTEAELISICVPENIENSIRKSIQSQNFSSAELKDRMFNTIIKDIKTQIWLKSNGFPCCIKCGIPVMYYNPEEETLCPSCKYLKI